MKSLALVLVLHLVACRMHLTQNELSITDYPKVCFAKGLRPARITNSNIAEAARLLEEAGQSQGWIRSFNCKYYAGYDLTVRMVERRSFARWYARWSWLEYAPGIELVEAGHDLVPLVCPVRKHERPDDGEWHRGLCEDMPAKPPAKIDRPERQQRRGTTNRVRPLAHFVPGAHGNNGASTAAPPGVHYLEDADSSLSADTSDSSA